MATLELAPHLRAPAEYAAATRVDHFAEWAEENCVQTVAQWAGRPLVFESWQLDFFAEALAVDDDETPFWSTVVLVVPRKNGKTTGIAAYATYHAVTAPGAPEVILAAASDKQAGRAFTGVRRFVQASPALLEQFHVREHVGQIARVDGLGTIDRIASNPLAADGANPSLTVVDELHRFRTPKLTEFWGALTTAGGGRDSSQVFVITTETSAEDADVGVLAPLIDGNEERGEVEERGDALTISRNFDSRTLIYRYSADRGLEGTTDPDEMRANIDAVAAANPASWLGRPYIARQSASPEIGTGEYLRLHGNVRVSGSSAWIDSTRWDAMREDPMPPLGSAVVAGVDVGLSNDTSAITLAWEHPDLEATCLSATTWAARTDVMAHNYVDGGRVSLSLLEEFLRAVADRVSALHVVYDPLAFERSAEILSNDGLTLVALSQASAQMAIYYSAWNSGVKNDAYRHSGDAVFRSHVLSASGRETPRGWKIEKIASHRKIDALVAAVMAAGHLGAHEIATADPAAVSGAW